MAVRAAAVLALCLTACGAIRIEPTRIEPVAPLRVEKPGVGAARVVRVGQDGAMLLELENLSREPASFHRSAARLLVDGEPLTIDPGTAPQQPEPAQPPARPRTGRCDDPPCAVGNTLGRGVDVALGVLDFFEALGSGPDYPPDVLFPGKPERIWFWLGDLQLHDGRRYELELGDDLRLPLNHPTGPHGGYRLRHTTRFVRGVRMYAGPAYVADTNGGLGGVQMSYGVMIRGRVSLQGAFTLGIPQASVELGVDFSLGRYLVLMPLIDYSFAYLMPTDAYPGEAMHGPGAGLELRVRLSDGSRLGFPVFHNAQIGIYGKAGPVFTDTYDPGWQWQVGLTIRL
jgi:hypothetical protein